jgi:monovalent cation/hydrogen antiporter
LSGGPELLEHAPDLGVGSQVSPLQDFQFILGLLAIAVAAPLVTRKIPLPPAATLLLGGMLLAALPGAGTIKVNPDLALALFLPPLLLSGALFTVWREFRRFLRPILLLALGAVAFTTFLVGCAAKGIVPSLPWGACFALGAIVSPPDAVVAKALLSRLPLPERIITILEGESLVNDAAGLMLYRFALAAALSGAFSFRLAVVDFVWLSFAGILCGWLMGRISVWIMGRLSSAYERTLWSFFAAWITYLICEPIGASGVLAVVTFGVGLGRHQHEKLTAADRMQLHTVRMVLVRILETLVFVLVGFSLRNIAGHLASDDLATLRQATRLAVAVVFTVMLARFFWLLAGVYLARVLSFLRHRARDTSDLRLAFIMGWAGMRGGVSLAAALALPLTFPGRDLLLLSTFCVIAVSILLQGTTLGPVIRLLWKQAEAGRPALRNTAEARMRVATAALRHLESAAETNRSGCHERLIEDFRSRLAHIKETDPASQVSEEIRTAQLRALSAARAELLRMHHSSEVNQATLGVIETELDLEELRVSHAAGATQFEESE